MKSTTSRISGRAIRQTASLLALFFVGYFFAASFPSRQQGTDFPEFYSAARILWEGHGHQLYDVETQQAFQSRYFGRVGTYFNHPPFEALIYLPFALPSPTSGYALWTFANVGLIVVFALLLSRLVSGRIGWPVIALLCLLSPPLLLNLFQGQDSLLLLVFISGAILSLRAKRDVLAGCLLALAMFKFHLIIALIVLVFCLRRGRALSIFFLASAGLALVSVLLCGPRVFTDYPRFLGAIRILPLAGIHPAQMANVRGLMAFCNFSAGSGLVLTLLISWFVVAWPAWQVLTRNTATGFNSDLVPAAFCLAAVLISYHLSPHDLTILLLPLGLITNYVFATSLVSPLVKKCMIALVAVLFLPPFYIGLIRSHLFALASVPLLALFGCVCWELSRTTQADLSLE